MHNALHGNRIALASAACNGICFEGVKGHGAADAPCAFLDMHKAHSVVQAKKRGPDVDVGWCCAGRALRR